MLKRLFLLFALSLAPLEDAQAACVAPGAPAPAPENAGPALPIRTLASEAAACPPAAEAVRPAPAESLNLRARLLESRLNRI